MSGITFTSAMTLILLTLKLCGVITWSWWLVAAPVLFSFAWTLGVLALMLAGAVYTIARGRV